jgi:hypothetical protein
MKFIGIVLLAVILRIVIQIIHGEDPLSDVLAYSSLVESIGISPVAGTMILASYFFLALIFVRIQKGIPGTKIQKGLLYGILFGILWFYGMIEGNIEQNVPLIKEIIFGFFETIPIITMSVLLGLFFADDSENEFSIIFRNSISTIVYIAFFYIIGRYFTYIVVGVESAYLEKILPTILWVSGNGVLIGSMYYFLRHGIKQYSIIKKALIFSFVVFGIDWILFNLFAPMLFGVAFGDIVWRFVIDIASVCFGIIFFEKIVTRKNFDNKTFSIQSL